MKISKKIGECVPSLTLTLAEKASAYITAGESVIPFGTGEPDFITPKYICDAAKDAIDAGYTKYDAVAGVLELRKAISEKFKIENNLIYSPDEIIVGSGAKTSLSVTLHTILDPGDEVIIPKPYWVSYTEMVKLAGGKPVLVDTDASNDFKMTATQLEAAITDKTAALILNTPLNPTGAFYTKDELAELADVILAHDIWCISDEIYEAFVYDGKRVVSIASLNPEIKKHTIIVNGFSKTFAMTGWRLGYAAGPKDVIDGMKKIQGHTISHPCTIAQHAGITALRDQGDVVTQIVSEFDERRKAMMARMDAIPGLKYIYPTSAFYIFVDISDIIGDNKYSITSAYDFVDQLLTQEKVVTIPGEAFGVENHVRFAFTTSMENIQEGFDRIERFLKR